MIFEYTFCLKVDCFSHCRVRVTVDICWMLFRWSETEENLRKNNSNRAYQLVKDDLCEARESNYCPHSEKCITEEWGILNRWTEYCSELYCHKASGDPSVLNCPQTDTEDDHPILRTEVDTAVQSLKKGKTAGSTTSQQNWSKQVERMSSLL